MSGAWRKCSGLTVRASRGCNKGLVALQRGRRCMMTAALSRPKEALIAEQIMTFWPKKAVFRPSEIAHIPKPGDNRLDDSSLHLHAQNLRICGHRWNIFGSAPFWCRLEGVLPLFVNRFLTIFHLKKNEASPWLNSHFLGRVFWIWIKIWPITGVPQRVGCSKS